MVLSSIHTGLTRTSSDLRMLAAVLLPPSPILRPDDLLTSSTSGDIPIFLEATTNVCDSLTPFRESPGFCGLGVGQSDTTRNIKGLTRRNENWMTKSLDETCSTTSHTTYYDLFDGDSECQSTVNTMVSTPAVIEDLDGDQLTMVATFRTCSTLTTPTSMHPFASQSEDVISYLSSPTSRQRHRRPLERARAVRFPGRPKSPRLQVNEFEAQLVRDAPPSPTKHASHRWQLADSPIASTCSCTANKVHSFVKCVALPEDLSWLKGMMIELWIDQEGFRAVRSCMQLIGYSPRARSLHPYESVYLETTGSGVAAGIAEFMPTKRETFAFHYATLDSPPMLRMVSVTGDESRDYTSRQATLSIKVNGVYTVLGTETFVASMHDYDGSCLQNLRLLWKFDYLVSDRKVDGTLPGEKTLTPLTFSCSPYLLHPLQGKKAGLLHTMKKTLVPKLGSQRLEPPTCAPNRHALQQTQAPSHFESGRSVISTTHARSHSAFTKGGNYSHAWSPLSTGVGGGAIQGMDGVQRTRRRRGSSAGEDSLTCSSHAPGNGEIIAPTKVGILKHA